MFPFPLKEGGEERAKQIPSQPRGDRDQTCEDAQPSHGSFPGLRANMACGSADACMSMEDISGRIIAVSTNDASLLYAYNSSATYTHLPVFIYLFTNRRCIYGRDMV